MIELLENIKSSHLKRVTDTDEQKKIWIRMSEQFKPDLSLYRAGRPSMMTARETGDLGLSVLWIVQAALIRPILKEIVLTTENNTDLSSILRGINHNSLCALAHSENPVEPVILTESGNGFIISGEKKFITAGENAELLIVTCRIPGEEKISRIVLIDPAGLPENSLPDLKLDIMRSVSHTKLLLKDIVLQPFLIPQIDSGVIRRMVKKFGILERSLIIESFLAFLLYSEKILNSAGAEINAFDEISSILEQQTISVTRQIDEAVYEEKIQSQNIPLNKLFILIEPFKKAYLNSESTLSESDRIKLKDIFLFNNLKG